MPCAGAERVEAGLIDLDEGTRNDEVRQAGEDKTGSQCRHKRIDPEPDHEHRIDQPDPDAGADRRQKGEVRRHSGLGQSCCDDRAEGKSRRDRQIEPAGQDHISGPNRHDPDRSPLRENIREVGGAKESRACDAEDDQKNNKSRHDAITADRRGRNSRHR